MSGTIEQSERDQKGLDSSQGANQPELGTLSETLSEQQLLTLAVQLAKKSPCETRPISRDRTLLIRFHDDARRLRSIHAQLIAVDENSPGLPHESDWLLDNFHLVDEQLREVVDAMPPGFFRELPRLVGGGPRIGKIAAELLLHSDYEMAEEIAIRFIDRFQSVQPLTIGELWAFPTLLRLTLVHALRQIADQILHKFECSKVARAVAKHWQASGNLVVDLQATMHSVPLIDSLCDEFTSGDADYQEALKGLQRQVRFLGWDTADVVELEQKNQASRQVAIGNIITSMRLVSAIDWGAFFEETSVVEAKLQSDPAGVYSHMEPASRDMYRKSVERLARRCRQSEIEIANKAIALAQVALESSTARIPQQHVGYWLVDNGLKDLEAELGVRRHWFSIQRSMLQHGTLVFFGVLLLVMVTSFLLIMFGAWRLAPLTIATAICLLLALLPLSEIAVTIANLLVTKTLPPRILPKMDFQLGIPAEFPTMVVVPCLLTSKQEVDLMLTRIESHYLANPDPQLRFALLTDFGDASAAALPHDQELLQEAIAGIRAINARTATGSVNGHAPFYLFHRCRQWNEQESMWMGWERKRGKLMEFGKLLAGEQGTSYIVREGDPAALQPFRSPESTPLIITLDADTQLPHDSARRLVGTSAHPLNRPEFDPMTKSIRRGYVILQPRVSIHLDGANVSLFSQLHSDHAGLDPYVSAASDVYQDLFGEGSFTGKGIYDLRVFERSLAEAFPENTILSHDLIEGVHTRVGLVSDIEVFDGFPSRYEVDAKRSHRWVRGDWQLLGYLFPKVRTAQGMRPNRLSSVSKWKIFDNLRRSLVAPALVLMLAIGWLFSPRTNIVWFSLASLIFLFPVLVSILTNLRRPSRHVTFLAQAQAMQSAALNALKRSVVAIIVTAHRATDNVDAIVRTLTRMLITRKKLLEWQTAASVEWGSQNSLQGTVRLMAVSLLVSLGLAISIPRESALMAAPWLSAWMLAPLLVYWVSRPNRDLPVHTLANEQQSYLRRLAYQTWSFFEAYVVAEHHWLPPDNVQEIPREKVANRISPTNEGLFLVSSLAARDLGFLPLTSLVELWEKNLENWTKLERHRGHFLNWYETDTLRSLPPRYVSTVDSGNLAASFLALRSGIYDLVRAPVLCDTQRVGLVDTLQQLCEEHTHGSKVARSSKSTKTWSALGETFRELLSAIPQELPDAACWSVWLRSPQYLDSIQKLRDLSAWSAGREDAGMVPMQRKAAALATRLEGLQRDLAELFPWHTSVTSSPGPFRSGGLPEGDLRFDAAATLQQLCELVQEADMPDRIAASEQVNRTPHHEQLKRGALAARLLRQRLHRLADLVERLALDMDFKFLYNQRRKLFTIGFNLDSFQKDRSHYDLLCSEARLASYFAIAKGDVPADHWFHLGRPTASVDEGPMLMSWGGTMFEYLMPPLFQKNYENSLLTQSCDAAIARQIAYGRARNVPWGISESAFAAMATNTDYHYRSFGVPELGIKRGLAKDLVVSPYSTMLALPIAPRESVENLRRLEKLGCRGIWGFFDAVDFTHSRVAKGTEFTPVRCYMSHHQGMGMLGIVNLLHDHVMQKRFHSHRLVHAAELLLQERTPKMVPRIDVPLDSWHSSPSSDSFEDVVSRRIVGTSVTRPRTHLLASGRYSTMITSQGGGYSRYNDLAVNRWRGDAAASTWGQFIYLKDVHSGEVWSPTYHPTLVAADEYEVLFSIDKAEFRRRQGDLESRLEVTISPEHDTEIRQLVLHNHGDQTRWIEVTTLVEVALCTQAADVAHPAFQKLFVETEYLEQHAALIARRRPRESRQNPVYVVHALAFPISDTTKVEFESSRAEFIGRNRTLNYPQALERELSGTIGAVLDPVLALRRRFEIPPGESVTLGIATAVAQTREEAESLADLYHDPRTIQRGFELAWAFAQNSLNHLHVRASDAQNYQRLASYILYPENATRGRPRSIRENRQGQSVLWRYGVSGDKPIVLARIASAEQMPLVHQLCKAYRYWASHGLDCDLVVLNEYPGSYFDELQEQMVAAIQEALPSTDGKSNGVYLLRAAQMPGEDVTLLEAVAACVLWGSNGPISVQLENLANLPIPANNVVPLAQPKNSYPSKAPSEYKPAAPGEFANGIGQFRDNGAVYEMILSPERPTPMPWSNVIANEAFGCLLTASGSGCTWAWNSRENKLSDWSNDPVSDPPSEQILIRDLDAQSLWSPFTATSVSASCASPQNEETVVRFGAGFANYARIYEGINSDVTVSLAAEDPVKLVRLRLRNQTEHTRRLAVTYTIDWVLGPTREATRLHLTTEVHPTTGALLVKNSYHADYPHQVAFLHIVASSSDTSVTADRLAFYGVGQQGGVPHGILEPRLNGNVGAGMDTFGAVQGIVEIQAGQEVELMFLVGSGRDRDHADRLLERYQKPENCHQASAQSLTNWREMLDSVQIETPNRKLDLLVNHWLLPQVLSCRIWGRTAFYQSGGAFGFRDQLQDAMAAVYVRPDVARAQILRAASRQYLEGDVQHWWHPPSGKGTRTRFSDDLLWLPLVTAHYTQMTGDLAILDEQATFIESSPLEPHEHERYELPQVSEHSATLYEHCLRALDRGCRFGPHQLPLMGCGDWNDGMNKVGEEGRGESVWVAWFLLVIFERFSPLARQRGDTETLERFERLERQLRGALQDHAWDGEWYLRAFFDDGSPLGSHQNDECKIDLLPQSWSVFAKAPVKQTEQALQSAVKHLVRSDAQLIQLFDPPFDKSTLDPGYIKGYLPGIRENGGQYTHAATWLVAALAQAGHADEAMRLMDMINPITHSTLPEAISRYRVEPYVMAADVYGVEPHVGRGGWTWYTGTAAWYYRVALEWFLGVTRSGNMVRFAPQAPSDWKEFSITFQVGQSSWKFLVQLPGYSETDNLHPHPMNVMQHTSTWGEGVLMIDDGAEHFVVVHPP